ncbi:Molybdopterin or thiamine biosynthesis adenylyltransferase [Sanguibacter gelidistatuariae]|uniref:Molybdopterin or thiamine biosynthesis adenylyltransferase n=1 Tax=Sanguibacter gelidistatuariae TaxID=1814289 RepID=A0A1G6L4D6_9MICO|nr:ThiF family adenylyltransferase [Sanguibacter gelidistatuariae]SDC37605.1 Molybdopterin or thiamine biosynthesis adenylyltransferase [Sanguibacter gelidistatuariae]
MKLRPGLRVLDRDPGTLQIGVDQRWATVLSGLTPAEATLLRTLAGPAPATGEDLLRRCAGRGVASARMAELLAGLDRDGLLIEGPSGALPVGSGAGDDARAAACTAPDGDGAQVVAARRRATVAVVGLGRLGMVLADTLASAGVGGFLFDDARRVRACDVGVGGLRERHVGLLRSQAAAQVLGGTYPALRLGAGAHEVPDVVVVVFDEVADSLRTVRLMVEGVAHLVVTVREGDVVVGPFVLPGRTPCLNCLDAGRTDLDPAWPRVRDQLKEAAALVPPAQESSTAAVAGALGAAQVLAQLDGRLPATAGACIEVSAPDAVPRLREWPMHPECGCIDVSGAGHG